MIGMLNEKKRKYLLLLLSIVIIVVYSAIYWNRVIPFTDGWGIYYAELMKTGKYPYRDFYVYLPPLNLVIDSILWKLSFGYFIIYRLYRVAERIILLTLIYKLLNKVVNPEISAIASVAGVLYVSLTNFDLLGDYNQTANVVLVLMTMILLKIVSDKNISNKKYLFFLGVMIGISFLLKQTVFVASGLFLFVFLTMIYIVDKNKNYIVDVIVTFMGAIVPILIAILVLIKKEAFFPFFEQVFIDAGAKGSLVTTLTSLFVILIKPKVIIIGLWFLGIGISLKKNNYYGIIITVLGLFLSIFLIYRNYLISINNIANNNILFACCIFIIICTICFGYLNLKEVKKLIYFEILVGVVIVLKSCAYLYKNTDVAKYINDNIQLFTFMGEVCVLYAIIGVVIFGYELYAYIKTKEKVHVRWAALTICGLIGCYYTAMTCVDYISAWGTILIVPIEIAYVLSKKTKISFLTNSLIFLCIIVAFIGGISKKITNGYQWWGWDEVACSSDELTDIDIKKLKGFRVDRTVKELYESIYTVIKENTDDSSVIYGFPHVKIFNVLVDNVDMKNFVPIPFYDVCADDYAKADAALLNDNPPDIVIWCDIPGCMEVHEKIFRDGEKLGQREIVKWFNNMLDKQEYVLIGQHDNLFVYKRGDSDINYIDIQDANRVNESLKTDSKW